MSRKAVLVVASLMFSFSAALADPSSRMPLPHTLTPGKPAGVRRAQSDTFYGAIAVGALAVIAIGGYAISARPYRIPGSGATTATSTQP